MGDELEPRGEEPIEDAGEAEIVGALNPWEKRPSEGGRAYQAFGIYRDMGPSRALKKVAARLRKDPSLIADWSSRHDWVERVEAYDLELDRRYREAREGQLVDIARRQAAEGVRLQLIAMTRLRGDEEHGIDPLSPADLSAADVPRYMELGVRIERLAMGMPTDLFRGALHVSLPELQDAMRKVLGLAIEFIPEARRGAFMTAVEGLGGGE